MVGFGSGKKGLGTKQPSTLRTVLTSKVPSIIDDLCKNAYGIKDNQKINCGTNKEET
jgi:hypothetical protein